MSVYDWPASTEEESDDDPFARLGLAARRGSLLDLEDALEAGRRTGLRSSRRARDRARRAGIAFAPPSGALNVWVPLGPTTVIQGQAANKPRVSGRVRALAVHPKGERLYAAAANGGIWYSSNAGASWSSIGGLAATDTAGITRPAHRHACGAILVRFDKDAPDDESKDLVFVGTGETTPGTQARPGHALGGVGIFVATGPASSAAIDPWTREAPNLAGFGVYRLAAQPGGSTVVAATSIGLFERSATPGLNVPWDRVASPPFKTLEDECTDVIWTPAGGGRPARLWVWAKGSKAGLWVRADGDASFTQIATPGALSQTSVLAAADPPTKVYVLNNRFRNSDAVKQLPALYRVDASGAGTPPAAAQVTDGVPDVLRNQGEYDITMAVDPANADRVAIAGAYLDATNPAGASFESYNGSIVVAEIGLKAGKLTFGHAAVPTMIGIGVHADVHDLQFAKAGARLWVSCDGGVFRSDHSTKQVGFIACNDGLSIAEANFVASHPSCEGLVAVGLQDNGVIERSSNGVWRVVKEGDGGGVAFDPADPTRYFSQYIQATWHTSSGGAFELLLIRGGTAVVKERNDEVANSSFYSSPGAIKHTRPAGDVGQILIGTDRVWYTEDWGLTWVTLPTGTDPITPTSYNRTQDQLDESVIVCRWAGPDVAWILTQKRFQQPGGQVLRLQRTTGSADVKGPGTWTKPAESILRQSRKNKKDATSADGPIREATAWTDLAVNPDAGGAQHGPKGAVYLGTAGHPTNAQVDTLWWFDGTKTWYPTGLRSEAVAAPVTAVLCDPANPDQVYVGTTVGVWRGIRTQAGNQPPDWVWQALVNGLPEAAVEDLSLFDSGGVRLLRAAIASRGIWEMELDAAAPDLTYLRAHNDDLRRRPSALETGRDESSPRSWHGSPDVRPRPAPAAVPKPTTLPWTRTPPPAIPQETLRRFQAALRSQKSDPRCRPTGLWDLYFEEVLRDHGAPQNAGKIVSIDGAFWDSVMVAPHVTAEPWGSGQPLEADLYELAPPLVEGDPDKTSCTLPPAQLKVDVVVQHRGATSIDGDDVRVTLLHWIDPKSKKKAKFDDATTWFSDPVPWTGAVNDVLNSPGGTTSKSVGPGWAFTKAAPDRCLTLAGQTLDSTHSGVATFDIDLRGAKPDLVVLLVAVIRVGSAIALAPAELHDLARDNPTVAVRSMRISA